LQSHIHECTCYFNARGTERPCSHFTAHPRKDWGEKQVKIYAEALDDAFHSIAKGEGYFRLPLTKQPEVFSYRCEHHYILYVRPDGVKKPVIIAIFHEKMSLLERLKERLPT